MVQGISSILYRAASPLNGPRTNLEKEFSMLRTLLLTATAAGAIALSAPTTASAGFFTGLKAPLVDAGPVEVQRNCYHRRHSSRWRCRRHRSWDSFWWD
jgi:hypothetical protein